VYAGGGYAERFYCIFRNLWKIRETVSDLQNALKNTAQCPHAWAWEGFFPGAGPIVDFPGLAKNIFAEVVKVAKFHFNDSKLRYQLFFAKTLIKCQCQI